MKILSYDEYLDYIKTEHKDKIENIGNAFWINFLGLISLYQYNHSKLIVVKLIRSLKLPRKKLSIYEYYNYHEFDIIFNIISLNKSIKLPISLLKKLRWFFVYKLKLFKIQVIDETYIKEIFLQHIKYRKLPYNEYLYHKIKKYEDGEVSLKYLEKFFISFIRNNKIMMCYNIYNLLFFYKNHNSLKLNVKNLQNFTNQKF